MREFKDDLTAIAATFDVANKGQYLLVRVDPTDADAIADRLGVVVRRCYLPDSALRKKHRQQGVSKTDLVRSKLPDRGSVMSGDFGEILTAVFQATEELPVLVVDPKKWRLKQDRRKAAPHLDVVQFALPEWDDDAARGASERDKIICSEVKTKATDTKQNHPIDAALAYSRNDFDARLVKALEWLKDRAIAGDLTTMSITQIDRFLSDAIDNPPYSRQYRAVAVICASLVDDELAASRQAIEGNRASKSALVVIAVPNLKDRYEAAFDAALRSVKKTGRRNG